MKPCKHPQIPLLHCRVPELGKKGCIIVLGAFASQNHEHMSRNTLAKQTNAGIRQTIVYMLIGSRYETVPRIHLAMDLTAAAAAAALALVIEVKMGLD